MYGTPEEQYLQLASDILQYGTWVKNKRTGKKVKTLINADLEYDCSKNEFPLLTTKKTAYKAAIAEMLGYLRGYTSAAQFRELGTNTWNANANAESWQQNPNCKGPDDMGYCYGDVGRRFRTPDGGTYDQLAPIIKDLSQGYDNRGEILTFWHPGTDHLACLRSCMHTHTFSILDGTLYLTSYQRSADIPLGVPFNMIQTAWLLMVMAKITGLQPGKVFHKMVNVHVYEDQVEPLITQLERAPYASPTLCINPRIDTAQMLLQEATVDDFTVMGYEHHPIIKFPFSV